MAENKKAGRIMEMICPNCGKKLAGITDERGGMRIICSRCEVRIYSVQKTPKKVLIEVNH